MDPVDFLTGARPEPRIGRTRLHERSIQRLYGLELNEEWKRWTPRDKHIYK
jgi:hypothetical protein